MTVRTAKPHVEGQESVDGPGSRGRVALVLASLVALLGAVVRTYAYARYSDLPSDFDGPMVFRQKYLLEHHSFLLHDVPVYSYWSSGVNTRLGFFLSEVLGALGIAFEQLTHLPSFVLHLAVFQAGLLGLALLLLGKRWRYLRLWHLAVVLLFADAASPTLLNFTTGRSAGYNHTGYSFLLILAIGAVYVSALSRFQRYLLLLLLAVAAPVLYHSAGFLVVTFLLLLWLGTTLLRMGHLMPSPLPIVVYYLAYQTYVSTQYFGELVAGVRDVLTLAFLRREPSVVVSTSGVKLGPVDLQYVHLVLYACLLVPVSYVALGGLRPALQRWRRGVEGPMDADQDRLRYWLLVVSLMGALALFGLAFGVRFSEEFLINRIAVYLALPTILAVAYIFRYQRPAIGWLLGLLPLVVLVSLASFWVQSSTVYVSTRLTPAEAEGYRWLAARLEPGDVVFTDFRLSGPFIADGHFRVLGITGEGDEPTRELLRRIYYTHDYRTISPALRQLRTYHDHESPNYLFLSRLMQEPYPAINGYGGHFDPVPPRFFTLLSKVPGWKLVYSNTQVLIYRREA